MAETRTEFVDGRAVLIVEEEDGDLRNYLTEGQEIETLDEEARQEKIKELCGLPEETQEAGEEETGQEAALQDQEPGERPVREPGTPLTAQDGAAILQDTMESRNAESARANTDVVLAMMVAGKAMEEAQADAPSYVVHGARAACSLGSREARLTVPLDHGTCLRERPQMTDQDFTALENVKSFGNCFSVENPNMEQAAVDATNAYNAQKAQSRPGAVKSWFGVKKVDAVSEELQKGCVCACTPEFLSPWTQGHEKNEIDGQKALLRNGVLVCQYGGIVRMISDGQEE